MLPYLVIGGSRSEFWGLTPKEIEIDFQAHQERERQEAVKRWEIGAYVKSAVSSSISFCVLANDKNIKDMPKYPEMPFKDKYGDISGGENQLTEEQIAMERKKAYLFFKNL